MRAQIPIRAFGQRRPSDANIREGTSGGGEGIKFYLARTTGSDGQLQIGIRSYTRGGIVAAGPSDSAHCMCVWESEGCFETQSVLRFEVLWPRGDSVVLVNRSGTQAFNLTRDPSQNVRLQMDTLQRPTARRSPFFSSDAVLHARERRLTVEEYHAMGEAGILSEDDRVELLSGHLVSMSPIGPSHAHCVNRLNELFVQRVVLDEQKRAQVGVQNPIRISRLSEPEPDVSLYDPGMPTDRHPGPTDLYLVVEVADSSVQYDRDVKAQAYGEAGIPEYWVVDLESETVEVFRRPEADGYAERIRHRRGDDLSITALPDLDPVPVADILGDEE